MQGTMVSGEGDSSGLLTGQVIVSLSLPLRRLSPIADEKIGMCMWFISLLPLFLYKVSSSILGTLGEVPPLI